MSFFGKCDLVSAGEERDARYILEVESTMIRNGQNLVANFVSQTFHISTLLLRLYEQSSGGASPNAVRVMHALQDFFFLPGKPLPIYALDLSLIRY